jgi:hypothetical protein
MTFEQMHKEAELLYESIDSSAAPGFTDEEWGQLLTIGQRKVVLNILKEGIRSNTFNSLALERLVLRDSYVGCFAGDNFYKNTDGTAAWRMTDPFEPKFFWVLDEFVNVVGGSDNIPVKHITYDFYTVNIKNPFREPNADIGYWILNYSTSTPLSATTNYPVFITNGEEVSAYVVIGVLHPDNYPIESGTTYPTVGGTEASCLNPSVHYMIVEESVKLARMSVVDTQGYQLALAEFAK